MTFASHEYVLFLLAAVSAYWALPDRWRKPFLLAASYFFYGSWNPVFLLLLWGVTLFNFFHARLLHRKPTRALLALGIAANLLPLLYYKYLAFLLSAIAPVAERLGGHVDVPSIALPLGISFFTFQAISYLVEVHGGFRPFGSLLDFAVFKAMWPQLIAGPIVRPDAIADQIRAPKAFSREMFGEGARRILQGLGKKVLLADAMAPVADLVFLPSQAAGAGDVVLGTLAFGLQIYFDFGGYSDIAVGSARLLGYRLPENFRTPYASGSFSEFWSRWHMTLSSWIRDYVYLPMAMALGGGTWKMAALSFLSMVVMGLWHGAGWTFVLWGAWHGGLLALQHTAGRRFFAPSRGARRLASATVTFAAVQLGWLFFRAEGPGQAFRMLRVLFSGEAGFQPRLLQPGQSVQVLLLLAGTLLYLGAAPRMARLAEASPALRARALRLVPAWHGFLAFSLLLLERETQSFIYFQF